ncbi:hypothetical protein [Tsukamurella soli]|uniref:hypothetical protein n=1 Tax=Tsukamurella soli TaxID=644556 RepID=UPI0036233091
MRILGRDGVGKATLARALERWHADGDLGPDGPEAPKVVGGAPADTAVYVFAGEPRATDAAAIGRLRAEPVPLVVVWAKADAAGSWRVADAWAREWAAELGLSVTPVMALLGLVDFSAADHRLLRAIAASPLAVPESVAEAAAALGPLEAAELPAALGGYGLACAVGALREDPDLGRGELSQRLRALAGIDAVADRLAAAATGQDQRRAAECRRRMVAAVLTDCAARDALEAALLDATVDAGPS